MQCNPSNLYGSYKIKPAIPQKINEEKYCIKTVCLEYGLPNTISTNKTPPTTQRTLETAFMLTQKT